MMTSKQIKIHKESELFQRVNCRCIFVVIGRIYRSTNSNAIISKTKKFCCNFVAFLESTLNFEHFERKTSLITYAFLKLLTPNVVVTSMKERSCFWNPLDTQRVNESQKLKKFTGKHFYSTFSLFWAKLN